MPGSELGLAQRGHPVDSDQHRRNYFRAEEFTLSRNFLIHLADSAANAHIAMNHVPTQHDSSTPRSAGETEYDAYPSPQPGRFQSFFIYLAGADPSLFRALPRNETGEWTKMGMTLCLPVVVAVIAGSITFYKLTVSIPWGVLSGLILGSLILLLDMAVMSALQKEPQANPSTMPGTGFAESKGTRFSKRRVFAIGRTLLAIVLGVIFSHALVLTFFSNRVTQQVEANRTKKRAEFDNKEKNTQLAAMLRLEQSIADVQRILNVSDNRQFLIAYDQYLKGEIGKQSEPVPLLPSPNEESPEAHLEKLESDLEGDAGTASKRNGRSLSESLQKLQKRSESLGRDLKTADRMLTLEKAGVKSKLMHLSSRTPISNRPWERPPRGIKTAGSRSTRMENFIQDKKNDAASVEAGN